MYNDSKWAATKNLWGELAGTAPKFAGKHAKMENIEKLKDVDRLIIPSVPKGFSPQKSKLSENQYGTLQTIYKTLLEGEHFEYLHQIRDVSILKIG